MTRFPLALFAALMAATACTTPRAAENAPVPAPRPSAAVAAPVVDGDEMVAHFLDVGQGAATLLEFPCGAALIDTGAELNDEFDGVAKLKEQLDAFFARRTDLRRTIDVLILTHPHIDHVRGVPMVLQNYVVKNIVDDGLIGERTVAEQEEFLHKTISERSIHYRPVKREEVDAATGLTDDVIDPIACAPVDPLIRVLSGAVSEDPGWPPDSHGKSSFHNLNNHSVVVRVDFGKSSLLITGDLENAGVHDLVEKFAASHLLDVDVYEVGHHGSYNATTKELLDAITPKVAVIEMGSDKRQETWSAWAYGHPRKEAVDLLEASIAMTRAAKKVDVGTGAKEFSTREMSRAIYGTGWDGATDVRMRGSGQIDVSAVGVSP